MCAGPEIFSIATLVRGLYQFYANSWGNFIASGYHSPKPRKTQSLPAGSH
jgi:uncharacterized protein YfaP (DUF2135 family)